MNLHDSAIAHVAKLIQMAILSGTDITDHLRMMRLEKSDNDTLILEQEYESVFNDQIEKMMTNSMQQQKTESEIH
jgi:hypothetical protein